MEFRQGITSRLPLYRWTPLPNALLLDSRLSVQVRELGLWLFAQASPDPPGSRGDAWPRSIALRTPSLEHAALDLGVTPRAVRARLKTLIDSQWIDVSRPHKWSEDPGFHCRVHEPWNHQPGGFVKFPVAVALDPRLTAQERVIYGAVLQWGNYGILASGSVSRFADLIGISDRATTRRYLHRLEDGRLIRRGAVQHRGGALPVTPEALERCYRHDLFPKDGPLFDYVLPFDQTRWPPLAEVSRLGEQWNAQVRAIHAWMRSGGSGDGDEAELDALLKAADGVLREVEDAVCAWHAQGG